MNIYVYFNNFYHNVFYPERKAVAFEMEKMLVTIVVSISYNVLTLPQTSPGFYVAAVQVL